MTLGQYTNDDSIIRGSLSAVRKQYHERCHDFRLITTPRPFVNVGVVIDNQNATMDKEYWATKPKKPSLARLFWSTITAASPASSHQ